MLLARIFLQESLDNTIGGEGGLCAAGSFQYDGKCVKYCDYTTCAAGLTKVEKDGRCCCK